MSYKTQDLQEYYLYYNSKTIFKTTFKWKQDIILIFEPLAQEAPCSLCSTYGQNIQSTAKRNLLGIIFSAHFLFPTKKRVIWPKKNLDIFRTMFRYIQTSWIEIVGRFFFSSLKCVGPQSCSHISSYCKVQYPPLPLSSNVNRIPHGI